MFLNDKLYCYNMIKLNTLIMQVGIKVDLKFSQKNL